MPSNFSSLGVLMDAIQARVREAPQDDRPSLVAILMTAVGETMDEISRGAEQDEFKDLTILNLIFRGSEAGYSRDELKTFIDSLKSGEEE